jgi:hypothetical protein
MYSTKRKFMKSLLFGCLILFGIKAQAQTYMVMQIKQTGANEPYNKGYVWQFPTVGDLVFKSLDFDEATANGFSLTFATPQYSGTITAQKVSANSNEYKITLDGRPIPKNWIIGNMGSKTITGLSLELTNGNLEGTISYDGVSYDVKSLIFGNTFISNQPGSSSKCDGNANDYMLGTDGVVWENNIYEVHKDEWKKIGNNTNLIYCENGRCYARNPDMALWIYNGGGWGTWSSVGTWKAK